MKSICGVLLLVACLSRSQADQLRQNFEKCKPEDNTCMLRRANEIIRSHPESFQELHMEKIDPLELKLVRFAGNPNTPVNFDLTMTDLTIRGLSDMTLTKIDGFKKNSKDIKSIQFEGAVPLVTVKGKYKASGKLLVVPISGEGDIHMTIKNLQIKTQLKAVVHERDGKTYVTTDQPKIKVKADGLHVDPQNLFNGEKTLADATIKVINDNWRILWDEMSPQLTQEITQKTKAAMNSFGDHFAHEDLFL